MFEASKIFSLPNERSCPFCASADRASPNAMVLATLNLSKIPSILLRYLGPGNIQLFREILGPDLKLEFPQILNFVVTPVPSLKV